MSTLLSKIVADFTTQLATAISTGGTTATLESITDDDGVTLPNGQYLLTIDGNNSQKEYWLCTLTGTSLTAIQNVSRQGARTAGCIRDHRVGASVSITDFAHILYINNLLTGVTDLDENTPLKYAADPGITSSDLTSLATVQFVVDSTTAGAPDATNATKGITKLSVAAVSPTDPIAVGDNDTRVPTQSENDALQGTSGTPSNTNRYVTNNDTTSTPTANAVVRGNSSGDIDFGWNPLSVSLPLYENINANELVKSINDNGTTKLQKVVGYGTQISKTTNGASTGQAQYGYFNNLFVYAYRNASDDDLEGFAVTQSGNVLTAGSLVELVAFAGSTVIPENVIVFSPTLYMVQTQNSGTTPDTQTFYVGTISGSTLSAPAVNTSYQDDDNISQVVRSSADKAVVTYSDGGVATYRIVNVTAAPTVSITGATVFTGGDTSTMINISDDRMILLSTSVGFDVYTVSSTLLTKVADNASVGTTGFRFFKTSDNNGVFGYSDGTDYYLRILSESSGTITWSNTTRIITSDTAIDGLSADGFGNYFVINGTNLFVYRIQGGSFVLQKTYTGFNGTITPFGYIGITGGLFVTSDPANTPVLMRSFYPDFQDTLGYINENGTAGQSKFLQRYGYKSGLSGLSTNVDYYVQNDATISGVSSAKILGKSISSTEIILDVSL